MLHAHPSLVIVIDGPKTGEQLHELCHQVDLVLIDLMRFCLVTRTPPEVQFSTYPVLAETVMRRPGGVAGISLQLPPWSLGQARAVWERSRVAEEPRFDRLPGRAKQLARVRLL
ncbi:hypothetical protein Raf01_95500 [Rugosimonospora africana]|uniref:Uncharacterized protein n=1 Tax=Rugosimonospora africana TaxID=556532 RepID=A0A8J3R2S6_9ACTN|nr:hypothetical protein Raf01_95500 [Rugosimonospora africana]